MAFFLVSVVTEKSFCMAAVLVIDCEHDDANCFSSLSLLFQLFILYFLLFFPGLQANGLFTQSVFSRYQLLRMWKLRYPLWQERQTNIQGKSLASQKPKQSRRKLVSHTPPSFLSCHMQKFRKRKPKCGKYFPLLQQRLTRNHSIGN